MSNSLSTAIQTLNGEMESAPDYAHAWHCNLAQAFLAAFKVESQENYDMAQEGASRFMYNLFGVKTSATPPEPKTMKVDIDIGDEDSGEIKVSRKYRIVQMLTHALNSVSADNEFDTPDFILAEYVYNSLLAFEQAAKARENWYGVKLQSGVK